MKNFTKNIIRKIILTSAVSLLLTVTALATTQVMLTPSAVNVTPGQSFTIKVAVDPGGAKNYAEKIELNYPSDLLEVKSFSLANGWMQLTQSGYDLIDNTNGVLVKSAGLPSGLTTLTAFGSLTFSAKKTGNGIIKIGNDSLAFEANSQNALSGVNVSVTVTASAASNNTQTSSQPKISAGANTNKITKTVPVTEATSSNQVAAVTKSNFNPKWLWLLVVAILFLPGIYYSLKGNKGNKKA